MFSLIPLPGKHKVIFAVVFHEDSLERIANHDPALVGGEGFAQALDLVGAALDKADILICYEADVLAFRAKVKELGNVQAVAQYLARNSDLRPGEDKAKYERVHLD
jgi:hypothetical protein